MSSETKTETEVKWKSLQIFAISVLNEQFSSFSMLFFYFFCYCFRFRLPVREEEREIEWVLEPAACVLSICDKCVRCWVCAWHVPVCVSLPLYVCVCVQNKLQYMYMCFGAWLVSKNKLRLIKCALPVPGPSLCPSFSLSRPASLLLCSVGFLLLRSLPLQKQLVNWLEDNVLLMSYIVWLEFMTGNTHTLTHTHSDIKHTYSTLLTLYIHWIWQQSLQFNWLFNNFLIAASKDFTFISFIYRDSLYHIIMISLKAASDTCN